MPPGPAFAYLPNTEAAWPQVTMTDRNVGGLFMGYKLNDRRRPIFMYQLGNVIVEEQFAPVIEPNGPNLSRHFSLQASNEVSDQLYFLVAEGDEIIRNDDNSWTIDERINITLNLGSLKFYEPSFWEVLLERLNMYTHRPITPLIRNSQGVQQLLLPINIRSGQSIAFEVKMSW
jgi:hypothetical protein